MASREGDAALRVCDPIDFQLSESIEWAMELLSVFDAGTWHETNALQVHVSTCFAHLPDAVGAHQGGRIWYHHAWYCPMLRVRIRGQAYIICPTLRVRVRGQA